MRAITCGHAILIRDEGNTDPRHDGKMLVKPSYKKPSASAGPNPLVTAHRQLIPKTRRTKICRLKLALTLVSTAATRTGAHCELAMPLPATRGVPDPPKPLCGAGHCQTDRRGTKD